ncbi:MAG: hypothetical protein RR988_04685 [Clostridia bacterium]
MKKFKLAALVTCIAALAVAAVYAADIMDPADTAATEITVNIEPEYVISIPSTLSIPSKSNARQKLDVTFAKGKLEAAANVRVYISKTTNNFKLKNGMSEIPYSIYNAASGGSQITGNGTVATFNSSTAVNTVSSIYAGVSNWNSALAGPHKDTIVFAINYTI